MGENYCASGLEYEHVTVMGYLVSKETVCCVGVNYQPQCQ